MLLIRLTFHFNLKTKMFDGTFHQVFMADKSQYYEVLVEYKGTKTSGAPMAAAAADWGAANIYARCVHHSVLSDVALILLLQV